MPFIKRTLIIGTLLAIAVLLFAATRPDTFSVERSINIKAAPETIYPLIDDLHNFALWSPYEKIDPGMKRTFSGAPSGKGAVYEWEGNDRVGHGRMEIIEAHPSSDVTINLDFLKPVTAHNVAEFTLRPNGNSTTVTWRMTGSAPYLSKVMSLFFSMDSMVAPQFEEGLANLRRLTDK